MKNYTLGSLFDGIGGFPCIAQMYGIEPVWASEIEVAPISITKRHFPNMKHLGDICKINGAEIEPVDIISGGSPCQDLSTAGKRAGLDGERSGLFMEMIRIIKEMRNATADKSIRYPRYVVWENVPGAFSSNKGEDFRAVVQEFCSIQTGNADIPGPPKNKWADAGTVVGIGYSFAWRVLDAQFMGVPQRRRRIYAVLALDDFTGERAGEILFKSQSERRNSAPCGTQGKRTAGDVEKGTDGVNLCASTFQNTGRGWWNESAVAATLRTPCEGDSNKANIVCYPINTQVITRHEALGRGTGFGLSENGEPAYTLQAGYEHGVCIGVKCLNPQDTQSARIYDQSGVYGTLNANSNGGQNRTGVLTYPADETERTLSARYDSSPCIDRGQNFIAFAQNQRNEVRDLQDVSGALQAEPGMKQQTYVAIQQNGCGDVFCNDVCGAISTNSNASGRNTPMVAAFKSGNSPKARSIGYQEECSPTLSSDAGGNTVPSVVYPEVVGTLAASGAGTNRPAGQGNELDFCITQQTYQTTTGTLMANTHPGSYSGQDAYSDMLVAAVDCRNATENETTNGTLQAKESGSISLNLNNVVQNKSTVRRLTPTECERLQGYPDCWTELSVDGKPLSDSARYKALGNSVALPCVNYVMNGIFEELLKDYEQESQKGMNAP